MKLFMFTNLPVQMLNARFECRMYRHSFGIQIIIAKKLLSSDPAICSSHNIDASFQIDTGMC